MPDTGLTVRKHLSGRRVTGSACDNDLCVFLKNVKIAKGEGMLKTHPQITEQSLDNQKQDVCLGTGCVGGQD